LFSKRSCSNVQFYEVNCNHYIGLLVRTGVLRATYKCVGN